MKMGDAGSTVRLGVIGLGGRGCGQMKTLLSMPDVEIPAVCDVYADRAEKGREIVREARGYAPDAVTDFHKVLERGDLDAVMIFTSWETHIAIAVEALAHGLRPAMEVGGASSIDECWQLVRASEKAGLPVMLLEIAELKCYR